MICPPPPPPPPPCDDAPPPLPPAPPPPPPPDDDEIAPPIFSLDLSPRDKFGALFVFGDYPRQSEADAMADVMRQVRAIGFDDIGAASLWKLGIENRRALLAQCVDPDNQQQVQRQAEYERKQSA